MNKRQALIDAAATLAETINFSDITLAQIASTAGINLGNVYYYFKSKDLILDKVVEMRYDTTLSTLTDSQLTELNFKVESERHKRKSTNEESHVA